MIGDAVTSAIETAKAEGVFRAVLHLVLSGYVLTDEERAALSALAVNGGRKASPGTEITHIRQAGFLKLYRAVKIGRGPAATEKAIAKALIQFPDVHLNVAHDIVAGKRPVITKIANRS